MNKSNFRNLLVFYVSYVWFLRVSSSIIPAYLLNIGTDINQMFLATTIQFISMLLVLLFVRIHSAKLSWRLAFISGLLAVLSVVRIRSEFQFFLTYIFGGISLALFFIYYNTAHFLSTPKHRVGVSSGIMFAISPIISIFAPLLAGSLVDYNINYLWLVSLCSFLLVYALTFRQVEFHIHYKIKESINAIRAMRIPIFLEGIWEAIIFSFIPLSTLHFIPTATGYGRYLAYLSLISMSAGLLIGHFSDKSKKRSFLLTPICLMLAIGTLGLKVGLNSLPIWIVMTSLIQFMLPIFWNLTTTLLIDQNLDLTVAYPGREIVLAFGRLIGLGFTYLCIISSELNLLLITMALVILMLPGYLYYQSKITHRFTYL